MKTRTPKTAFKDRTGVRYGRLVAVRYAGVRVSPGGSRRTLWTCRCDCGNELEVAGGQLQSGKTQSCGCLAQERLAAWQEEYGELAFPKPVSEIFKWAA